MTSVATLIAKSLKSWGLETFFCVTGGDHGLWIALHDNGVRIVNCRCESAAVNMADGFARITGRPTFVYGQRGPGASYVAGSMCDPFWAKSPVVSLTSATPMRARDQYGYMDLDGMGLHAPLVRWNRALHDPAKTVTTLISALRAAAGPTTGPVHLEVPSNVLNSDVPDENAKIEPLPEIEGIRIVPAAAAIEAAAEMLVAAERPLILAGKGVIFSRAWDDLSALAETTNIPVATSLGGKGSVDETSNLALGVVGRHSRKVSNAYLQKADVILAIGTRLGGLVTNETRLDIKGARIIHVDTDYEAFDNNYPAALAIQADAALACRALSQELAGKAQSDKQRAWCKEIAGALEEWRVEVRKAAESLPADGIHPATVVRAVRAALGPDDILATDCGASAAWGAALFPATKGLNYLRSNGTLGWVIPAAMGAVLAVGSQRRVVALSGDGGAPYHFMELETALRCDIPFVAVIMNNRCLGSEYHGQKERWQRNITEVLDFYDVNYAALAQAFGAHGERVSEPDRIPGALRAALDSGKPAIVEILISKETSAPNGNRDAKRAY